jgi:hypothetical protein
MIVITILSVACAGVITYSMTTYRNSVRQATLDQCKVLADQEIEYIYYQWKGKILGKTPVDNLVSVLAGSTTDSGKYPAASSTFGQQTVSGPFDTTMRSQNPAWTVTASLSGPISIGGSDSAVGIVPGTQELGHNYYFDAYASASRAVPLMGTVTYYSGRHFVYSNTSLFQFAVFYQGDLEMAAGGNMTISGPISTNASAYLGSHTGYDLTLTDKVYYYTDYNGAADPLSGETDYLQGTSSLSDPVYNPNPNQAAPSDQTSQRALQVSQLQNQNNFLGGVNITSDINNPDYALAYSNQYGAVDVNEIYRAVIAPPPVDGSGNDLPEDPTVAASRMYNSAGILITIEQTTTAAPVAGLGGNITIHVGIAPDATTPSNPANVSLYDNLAPFASITNPTGATTDVLQNVRQTLTDPREFLNGSTGVALTTVNVGNLNTAITAAMALSNNAGLSTNYNGVVYVYDKTTAAEANPTANLKGILLNNATTTPAFNDQNGNPLGFSVVTDNGLYVQGDYNTTPITVNGSQVTNPSALMGDAVTALSYGFSVPANAGLTYWNQREAVTSPGEPNGMVVDAAVLTGNTPTTSTVNSGGAQNLVRMIEDWYYPNPTGQMVTGPDGNPTPLGMQLTLNGSLGQLFHSKYFSSPYATGAQTGLAAAGAGNYVYIQPKTRVLSYDQNFKLRSPAGSPSTTNFTRGPFFSWTP